MKKLTPIILLSIILGYSNLTRGQLWYDDFASYIMQAQSLLNGTTAEFVQHNAFTINTSSYPTGPIAYPWGYPFLIAPVLYFFGLKIIILKLVSTMAYTAFLIIFYRLARFRLTENWSLALTAILAFNPALLYGQDDVSSDIVFLLFSTLALFLIEYWSTKEKYSTQILIGVSIFLGFFMRTNGILLLVPLVVSQLVHIRSNHFKSWFLFIPYLIFGLLFLLVILFLPHGQESQFNNLVLFFTPQRLFGNIVYYLKLPLQMFENIPLGMFFYYFILIFFFIGAYKTWRENAHLLAYTAGTMALFMAWPETQGLRFIFPILPLFIMIAAQGMTLLPEKFPRFYVSQIAFSLLLVLSILSLGVSVYNGWTNVQSNRQINGPFDEVSAGMFEYIREHTPTNSIIIFFKPRAMRLLTNRDSFMTVYCKDLTKGDYIVIHEKRGAMDQLTQQSLAECPVHVEPVFNNKRFTVYQILK